MIPRSGARKRQLLNLGYQLSRTGTPTARFVQSRSLDRRRMRFFRRLLPDRAVLVHASAPKKAVLHHALAKPKEQDKKDSHKNNHPDSA